MARDRETVTLIHYGGRDFYRESGTVLSSITHTDFSRTDYGKLQIMLEEGRDVLIRQATPEEMEHMTRLLERVKQDNLRSQP